MRWFRTLVSKFLPGRYDTGEASGAVQIRPWPWRHPRITAAITAVVVVAAGIVIWQWVSRSPCGSGLTEAGDPSVCVGLDVDSTALRANDPLADLEQRLAALNAKITTPKFVTVVLIDDLTPDPTNDSLQLHSVRHEIQGALTAAWRANNQSVAVGETPPVKLLLASFGSGAQFEAQTVTAIISLRDSQHIVAVTGFGQSLDTTRQAASDLSKAHIASIGSSTSGDNMNRDPATNDYIQRFYRITPTNTDAANAAVTYLVTRNYRKVMLVQDTNESDLYATTLGQAFDTAYRARYGAHPYTKTYESPDVPLSGINRATYMIDRFAAMSDSICLQKPDLIYFAGRGSDLGSFLTVLAQAGACDLTKVDVMSSDDANNLLGRPLPNFGKLAVNVFYTAVATGGEWNDTVTSESINAQNYQKFLSVFVGQHFGVPGDLVDGYVMMTHDAVLAAATAARNDPDPVDNPTTVADQIGEFDCQSPIPGATGQISFTPASHGNPIDKAMPIVQIAQDGSPHVRDLAWTTGQAFSTASCG